MSDRVHVTDDLCLDLLHGLLNEDERDVVITHLRECGQCAQRFQERAGGRERDLAAVELGDSRVVVRPRTRFAPRRWISAGAVAAAAVVLFLLVPRGENMSELLVPLPLGTEQLDLRADPGTDTQLRAGLDAYGNGDYASAVTHLTQAPDSNFARIFLAAAMAQTGDAAGAQAILEDVELDTLPEPWRSESRWSLYVVHAMQGNDAAADRLLTEMVEEPGPVGDRARALR